SARTWDPDDEAGSLIAWAYDGAGGCDAAVCTHTPGQLTEVSYPLLDGERGAERFGFDARGRGVRRQYLRGAQAFDFTDAYDNAARHVGTSYPGGIAVTSILDGLGRTVAVPGYVDAVAFTARNQVASLALANGAVTTHAYDEVLRIHSLSTAVPAGTSPLDYGYAYDREGHITSVADRRPVFETEPSETAEYAYDSLYRLI